jgi:2-(1,2-epoxy-1,2-dihydrophenyl)acetyl-CoA isomerase
LLDLDAAGVATVTLNREQRKNGITKSLIDEALTVLSDLAQKQECRVVVLTGAGTSFCAGMDLSEPIEPDEFVFMRRVGELCRAVYEFPTPMVAKVRGAAMGFGANLALCADLVVADDTAVFGEVFADRGLTVDGGGTWLVPRRVGLGKAKELLLLAAKTPARDACDMGLINRCVAPDELDGVVAEWAGRLADGPKRALASIKQNLNASSERSFHDALSSEAQAQVLAFGSKESREGVKAFFQKRPPDFRSC